MDSQLTINVGSSIALRIIAKVAVIQISEDKVDSYFRASCLLLCFILKSRSYLFISSNKVEYEVCEYIEDKGRAKNDLSSLCYTELS